MQTLLKAEYQAEHADSRQSHACPVEGVRVGLKVGHERARSDKRANANRDVNEEDPFPTGAVDKHTAQQGAEQAGHSRGGAPQRHGASPLGRGERPGNDGHRLRRHERGTDPLDTTRGNQVANAAARQYIRQAACERRQREDDESYEVDTLGSVPVAKPSRDEQRHRIGEQVGARHPNDRVRARMQALLY
jgi:hypothetical protein